MVFSRIKKQTEKLKEKNFADRAKSKGKQLASEVKKLTGDVEQGEELTEDVEETGDRDELKQDISEQRNIFEEFEVVEADAREVLTLEEEELESLHKGVEIDIEREKQVESIVLAFGDEIDGVERLVSEIRETLQSDVRKFNTQCFKQAKELGPEGILEVLNEAKQEGVSRGLEGSLGNDVDMLLKENGISMRNRENFKQLNLQNQVDNRGNQNRVVELAICLNEVLYELPERDCIDKKRYVELEEELNELRQLFEKFKEVAEEMRTAIGGEEEIEQFVELEAEQLPESIEELREIGEELQVLGKALEEEEATEREVIQITEKMTGSNARQINKEAKEEVKKLEENLGKLERYGNKLVKEAERLENESKKLGELEGQEEEELEKILEKGEKVRNDLKKISNTVLHSDKVVITPEDPDRERFEEDAASLEIKISYGVDQISSIVATVMQEAEKLAKISEQEQEIEMEITSEDLSVDMPF